MRRLLLAVAPCLAGCYAYAPIPPGTAQPGTGVRARVSAPVAERIAPLIGVRDARLVSGRLVEYRADTIVVEVPTVPQAIIGTSVEALHQRVLISRAELLELETRRLDRARTAILTGTVAAAVVAATVHVLNADRAASRRPGSGGGPEARFPLAGMRF